MLKMVFAAAVVSSAHCRSRRFAGSFYGATSRGVRDRQRHAGRILLPQLASLASLASLLVAVSSQTLQPVTAERQIAVSTLTVRCVEIPDVSSDSTGGDKASDVQQPSIDKVTRTRYPHSRCFAHSKSTKGNRDECRCVASFYTHENRMLRLCVGFIHELPNVCGRVNGGLPNV